MTKFGHNRGEFWMTPNSIFGIRRHPKSIIEECSQAFERQKL